MAIYSSCMTTGQGNKRVFIMKKQVLFMLLLASITLPHQTAFGMDSQKTRTAQHLEQEKQSFLKASACHVLNWVMTHKKQLLIGSTATLVAAYVLCTYYFPAQQTLLNSPLSSLPTPPLPQAPVLVLPAVVGNGPNMDTANKLLEAANKCAYPYECLKGRQWDDKTITDCAFYFNTRMRNIYHKCYDKVIDYAHQYGLVAFRKHIDAALGKAAEYWNRYGDIK
jgi:hypothetical protein